MSRPTAAQKRYWSQVASLGCLFHPGREASIHHSRDGMGMSQRDHWKVVPLCRECHQDGPFARHKDPAKFVELHGTDSDLLEEVNRQLAKDLT